MFRSTTCAIAICLAIAAVTQTQAAITYLGGTYSQNFDTLPNGPRNTSLGNTPLGWIDDTAAPAAGNFSIVGWYLFNPDTSNSEGGFNGNQRLRVGGTPTTSAAGSFYAFGDADSTDRALGAVPSGTIAESNTDIHYGLRLTNDTGNTLTQFTVDYTAEQWRSATPVAGRPAGNQSVTLDYRLGGTDLDAEPFIDIPGGGFDSIIDSPPLTGDPPVANPHLNGNDPANRLTGQGATVTGINWAPGEDLWVRWSQTNVFSAEGEIADHGLAIDDLTFSAQVPEPTGVALAALAAMALLAYRRVS